MRDFGRLASRKAVASFGAPPLERTCRRHPLRGLGSGQLRLAYRIRTQQVVRTAEQREAEQLVRSETVVATPEEAWATEMPVVPVVLVILQRAAQDRQRSRH